MPDMLEELLNSEPEVLAKKATRDSNLLEELFDGVSSSNAKMRFKSAKILSLISEKNPEKLYPRFDFFKDLLRSANSTLKWNAIDIIANLASVDVNKKFEKIFTEYVGLLQEGSLITAGHVAASAGKIVNAKPNLEERITKELLQVEKIKLPTEECGNILAGHTILSFDKYFDKIQDKDEVILFVKRQLKNTRNATRAKAAKFLKKHSLS
jgi:hypothetical protein